jgi:predicted Zn-dependent protease
MLLASAGGAAAADPAAISSSAAAAASADVQKLVDALRGDLALSHQVYVELVEHNPLKASVEPVAGSVRTFRLSIEQGFLALLTPHELRAVVAHELGHVWIYTHHPYLQTEQLANKIALRVVTRADLDKVYGKVWPDSRNAGSLPRFPEQQPAVAAAVVTVDAPAPRNEN